MTIQLGATTRRILGVLVEKEMTTPNQYPLSVHSLTTGCNQKTNRYPVTSLDDYEVQDRLRSLHTEGWVTRVEQDGARVVKWSHRMAEKLGVGRPELAVLAELLLRGAQQPGELRSRASRMHSFPSQESLESAVRALIEKGHVRTLPPKSGERAVRHDHTLYAEGEEPVEQEGPAPTAATRTSAGLEERVACLERELIDLKARLEMLEEGR